MSEHTNPYVINSPIRGDEAFFGRQELLQAVETALRDTVHNSVILYGQRRIGKTSLLLQLEKRLPKTQFFAVYFDLAGKAMLSVGQVLYELAAAAATKAGIAPPAADTFEHDPSLFHKTFLPRLYSTLTDSQRPVFLLDEFEMVDIPELDLPDYLAVRSLDAYLLWLLAAHRRSAFVFTAGRRMIELDMVRQSHYQAGLTRLVSVLNTNQARALITQPGAPEYEPAAIEEIIKLAGGHPALIQQLCHALWAQRAAAGSAQGRIIRQDVTGLLARLLTADNADLLAIWRSLPPTERLVLAAAAGSGQPAAITDIEGRLREANVPEDLPGLAEAPTHLTNWQMFEPGDKGFTFAIDFMRRWVARQQPLAEIAPLELARLDPRPAALYLAARRSLAQDNTAQALNQLDRALAIHSGYLPALFMRGSILEQQGKLEKAVESYEQAYQLSPVVVAGALAAALVRLGLIQEQANKKADALAAYERALQVDPQNEAARQRRDALAASAVRTGPRPVTSGPGAGQQGQDWKLGLLAAILLFILCTLAWASGLLSRRPAATDTVAVGGAVTVTVPAPTATHTPAEATRPSDGTSAAALITPPPTATAGVPPTPVPPTATATATATPQVIAAEGQETAGSINLRVPPGQRPLLEAVARSFTSQQPAIEVVIETTNSAGGLQALEQGLTDVALVARDLSAPELAGLNDAQLYPLPSNEPVVIITHPTVGLTGLTVEQARDIFSGAVTNWGELGGPEAPIIPVLPPAGSDTRLALSQQLLAGADLVSGPAVVEADSDAEVVTVVNGRPYAIGLAVTAGADAASEVSLQTANWAVIDTILAQAAPLTLAGAAPTVENTLNGSYPLVRPLNLVISGSPAPAAEDLITFILSPAGQQLIQTFREESP